MSCAHAWAMRNRLPHPGWRTGVENPYPGSEGIDHVEGVGRVAAMGAGVGERADHPQELHGRAGPAVGQQQRERAGLCRPDVQEMDRLTVDRGDELRDLVERRLGGPPVVAGPPVLGEVRAGSRRARRAPSLPGQCCPASGYGRAGRADRRCRPAGSRCGRGGCRCSYRPCRQHHSHLGTICSAITGKLAFMLETSARLLRLLSIMQSRRDWSGPELAARLQVTTRTIRNDVERLRQLGYPVDATPGAGGGYRLGTGAAVPPLLLDDEEAVAVAVGLRTAANGSVAGIEEASIRALAKLQQLLPSALRRRLHALEAFAVPVPGTGPVVDAATLTTLAAACRDAERVRFGYRRHDGSHSHRDVEPHRLVSTGRRWYLVAWDIGQRAWRTFRVDRIGLSPHPPGPALPAAAASGRRRGTARAEGHRRGHVELPRRRDRARPGRRRDPPPPTGGHHRPDRRTHLPGPCRLGHAGDARGCISACSAPISRSRTRRRIRNSCSTSTNWRTDTAGRLADQPARGLPGNRLAVPPYDGAVHQHQVHAGGQFLRRVVCRVVGQPGRADHADVGRHARASRPRFAQAVDVGGVRGQVPGQALVSGLGPVGQVVPGQPGERAVSPRVGCWPW